MLLKFKTNIKCTGCIATITPELNGLKEVKHWEVDLASADKVLTVEGEDLQPSQVKDALKGVGYTAEQIS
ncbi:heavy-metal-associated domain-containing protein [Solitalea sp. MAHUQ-68]|uniref:Heavy-metal-associated domain-containing protein n=1 Tax=Solitalea agri TaxID=2953739 RepID=A0A9X2F126_9SPHI|nr:heavy-metal-associated domain-containing protein [Solitalea agri]MCO4292281.1 heavy-metal-associated domain-containing protein [Solitalea agri]